MLYKGAGIGPDELGIGSIDLIAEITAVKLQFQLRRQKDRKGFDLGGLTDTLAGSCPDPTEGFFGRNALCLVSANALFNLSAANAVD